MAPSSERNVLLGGEPGAGKSAALSMLVATAALDPTAKLWLLDGKLVELSAWAPCAERLAGPEVEEAIELLRTLRREMDERYRVLLAAGRRKVGADDGLPLHLVACDELAFYLTVEDRKKQREFSELLRDLVARGRAAGVIVCAATQKPAADVVPSALRDLFGFRLALRCNTPQASDTILGQGWATLGHNAAAITPGQRGVGLLLAEDGIHEDDDPCLGEAICRECFDYERSGLWNHNVGRLFRRTRTYVERELGRRAGLTQKAARELVRVSYVKVAEFQRRGVVHFHVLWRLDAADDELAAPPEPFDAQLLADAIRAALPKSTVPAEDQDGAPYGWGRQHELRALDLSTDRHEAARVAGYIAKYATKSTQDAGGVGSRIEHEHELDDLRCRDHARRLISGAWQAGKRENVDGDRIRRWAHQFGFGGHCFTKSRRFSTTFKALREARALYAAAKSTPTGEVAAKSDHNLVHISAWWYAGRGYRKAGDALLAASSHARAREHRRLAREAQHAAADRLSSALRAESTPLELTAAAAMP